MAQKYKAPLRDYGFIYNEMLDLEQYKEMEGFEQLENFSEMLEMTGQFAEEVLLPINQSGDQQGAKYDPQTKEVTLPDGHVEAYKQFCELGFPAFNADPAYGGYGLPQVLSSAVSEMLSSGAPAWGMLAGLSHGAYSCLHEHGSDELKDRYLPKMVTGEWAGVMALTEADHGTDLPGVKTKAIPDGNGSFKLSGEKIFISCGDQNATENIVHLVLARIPDDAGVDGAGKVSLFVVPKQKLNEKGELTNEKNGVYASGLEEKMGIHASPTATLQYEEAEGYMVGAPGKGLQAMFTMMNEERLGVGAQGLGMAEVAYQTALDYAKERVQGKHVDATFDKEAPNSPIIDHEDVRRMLLEMRSTVEGGRALAAQTALMLDVSQNHPDEAQREKADTYVGIMTPIIKAMTDDYYDVTDQAIQVFGGHGYIAEQGVEQLQRDARITRIYEGTNGVQAKDLAMRKVLQASMQHEGNALAAIAPVLDPIREQIAKHADNPEMADYIKPLEAGLKSLEEATQSLMKNAQEGGLSNADAGSTAYLKLFTKVAMGSVWAQQAAVAQEKLQAEDLSPNDKQFYEAKLVTAGFYQNMVLDKEHAALKAKVTEGKRWIPELPDVEVNRPRAVNDNIRKIVEQGPKNPQEHAQRQAGDEIAR